jgi:ubiquitin carboxyl-terminal hydrolase 36/42
MLSSKTQKHSTNGYSSSAVKSSNTNGNGLSSATCSEALKIPLLKQNGPCSTKGIAPLPLTNGKIALGPHIKPIHLKNTGTEKVASNGKQHIIVRNKSEVNGAITPVDSNGSENGKSAEPSKTHSNGSITCDKMDIGSQRMLQDADGNGYPVHFTELQETNGAEATCAEKYPKEPLGVVSSTLDKNICSSEKSKSSDLHQAVSADSAKELVASVKGSARVKHHLDEGKFKEMLAESASSELRSSVWADDVCNFMRSAKRQCIQNTGTPVDSDAIRLQLISDSRRVFRSKIPESLREDLIKSLKSYFQDKF